MPELNPLYTRIKDMQGRLEALRGYLDFETKSERLIEVSRELEVPELWNEPERRKRSGGNVLNLKQSLTRSTT